MWLNVKKISSLVNIMYNKPIKRIQEWSMRMDTQNIELFDSEEQEKETIKQRNFSDVVTWGTDWTMGTIVDLINRDKIDLNPEMQRREVWDNKKKSKLIESIILNIPIPQIILAEKKEKKGTYMVIDGKQRLLSIVQFLNSMSSYENNKSATLTIQDLEVIPSLNGKTANSIYEENTDALDYIDSFENQTIRTIIIKNWDDVEILYTVFNRLNTGTVALSAQELRMTLYPGNFMNFAIEHSSSKKILKLLKVQEADARMRDVELVIRYYSFKLFLNEYAGKLKSFFDFTVDQLNEKWNTEEGLIKTEFVNLEDSIILCEKIFNEDAFKVYDVENKVYKRQFNKSAYDLLTYFLSHEEVRNELNKDESSVIDFKTLYESLFYDAKFTSDFQAHTTDLEKVKYRFSKMRDQLNEKYAVDLTLPFEV